MELLGGQREGFARVDHVIKQDGILVTDVTHQDLHSLLGGFAGFIGGCGRKSEGLGATTSTLAVDKGKVYIKVIGECRCPAQSPRVPREEEQKDGRGQPLSRQARRLRESLPFRATGVWRDNDAVPPVLNTSPDPLDDDGLGPEIIDRNVKEALDLGRMEVNGDDVIASSHLEHVGH